MLDSPRSRPAALFDQTNGVIAPSLPARSVGSPNLLRLVSAAVLGFGGLGR